MTTNHLPQRLCEKLESLDELLAAFAQELKSYSNEQLNAPGPNGGWSAMQCVKHLKLSEQGIMAYIQKKLSFDPELPKAGFTDAYRRILLNVYLASPVKFAAPRGIDTPHLPQQSDPRQSFEEWFAQRKLFRAGLAQIDPKYHDKQVFKHPLAGRVSLDATLSFMVAHFKRHRKQALRAIKSAS